MTSTKEFDVFIEAEKNNEEKPQESSWKRTRYPVILLLTFVLTTSYLIASLVITPRDPFLRIVIYSFISLKLVFEVISTEIITKPLLFLWEPVHRRLSSISSIFKLLSAAVVTLAIILVVTYTTAVTENGSLKQRSQSLLGLFTFLGLMTVTSNKITKINWHAVASGILIQVLLGIFIFKTEVGITLFQWLSDRFLTLIKFSDIGSKFLFGEMAKTPNLAFSVFPAILFFAAFIEMLYYIGAMQWLIIKFAWFFKILMNISGCESVVAAASPFFGLCEAPMLVKPFIAEMTTAELHQVMTSGASTIAGSVMVAYINFGINSQAIITSLAMSIPCSLALSKLRYPEQEVSQIYDTVAIAGREEKASNILHAAVNGACQGINLCLFIGGILLAVVSIVSGLDAVLTWLGSFLGFQELTFKFIMSFLYRPFAWLIGIPWSETQIVGEIMATKMFINEFAAFTELAKEDIKAKLSQRSQMLASFAICGFASFGSMGVQIGTLGAMAPNRRSIISSIALSAMLTGTMCTFISATVAGLVI